MRPPAVHVAMLGARQHYAVPALLHRAGMLGRLYTDLYAGTNGPVTRLLSAVPRRLLPQGLERFLGRAHPDLPAERVVAFHAFGLWYAWRIRRARDARAVSGVYAEAGSRFARRVVGRGLRGADALFSYNGPALALFEHARARGIPCVLEQILAPQDIVRALLGEELERWPGWEPGLRLDGDDDLGRQEPLEWRLADLIVGGSSFVIDGLRQRGVPEARCRLVPYGVSLERFAPRNGDSSAASPALRILHAGGVELRKGAPYLLEALRMLGSSHVEARFAGPVALSPSRLRPYRRFATFLGPVPRSRMMELYRWADLLVLPSICEGSALVTYEALASGVPVVATPGTGAWVRDGVDGVIVPSRDVEALTGVLERVAGDRDFLRFLSRNASADRARLGLDAYQARLIRVVEEVAARPAPGPAGPRSRTGRAPEAATGAAGETCSLCGSEPREVVHRGCRNRRAALAGRFDLLRCRECGVVYLSPRPSAEVLSAIYSGPYQSHAAPPAPRGRLFRALRAACLLPYRLRFGHERGTFAPSGRGRLLDVGCGTGDYLSAMARLGWACSGCDVSEPALAVARRRLPHATLRAGTVEGLPFEDGSFEMVSLWHTLEHLPDPRGALRRIRRLLAPGGRLVVAVPNIESLEARLLGRRWAEIDIPGHLFFFSPATLRALLEKAGFECLRLRPQVHPSTVSDALGFALDDLLGRAPSRQRTFLYYLLFAPTAASYALGNWGCVEAVAGRR